MRVGGAAASRSRDALPRGVRVRREDLRRRRQVSRRIFLRLWYLPETQFFNKCPAGYFCPEGTAASGRYQFPCSACHYCPEGTGVILPRCPEGTRSDPNAENIDQCIADRITFWRIQPLKRVLIDEAYAMLLLAYNESTSDRRRSLLELGEGAEADRIGGVYKPKAHKYDQDISYEAVQKLGEYVAALPREETYVEEMGRRRRLLQDAAAADAPAANVTEGDNTTTVATGFDTTYFGSARERTSICSIRRSSWTQTANRRWTSRARRW